MDDNQFWALVVKWAALFLITVTLCITAYNVIYFYAPVRPQQTQMYYWPPAFGPSVNGTTNSVSGK